MTTLLALALLGEVYPDTPLSHWEAVDVLDHRQGPQGERVEDPHLCVVAEDTVRGVEVLLQVPYAYGVVCEGYERVMGATQWGLVFTDPRCGEGWAS
jgi:hypothetical protein